MNDTSAAASSVSDDIATNPEQATENTIVGESSASEAQLPPSEGAEVTFASFALPPVLQSAVKAMGFTTPTPIQQATIPLALAGRDLIASAQTGSGKTAAFGLPLLSALLANKEMGALVLAPTRELAAQVATNIRTMAKESHTLHPTLMIGGVRSDLSHRFRSRPPRVIVATPGRLCDYLKRIPQLLSHVGFLVLDEADRMLDLGFAPQLRIIRGALREERQTLLFSATFPTDIRELARDWLSNPERITIGTVTTPAAGVTQKFIEVNNSDKQQVVLKELNERSGSMLIFTRTKRRADQLSRFLEDNDIEVAKIHGDRSQVQRRQALEGFHAGEYRVLVATDIAARGIDVPHIAHVLNFDLPFVPEDYLHRIGRTARAGRTGESLSLVAPEERSLRRGIEKLLSRPEGLHSSEREPMPRREGRGGRSFDERGPRRSGGGGFRGGSRSGGGFRGGSRGEGGGFRGERRSGGSFERREFGDRPARRFNDQRAEEGSSATPRSFDGAAPAAVTSSDRAPRSENRPYAPRPRRNFGDRPSYGDRPSFGDRRGGGNRPYRSGPPRRDGAPASFGDRAAPSSAPRAEGDRPAFGGDRPYRSGGGRSFGNRSFGDRPQRSFSSDRPQRSFNSDRPYRSGPRTEGGSSSGGGYRSDGPRSSSSSRPRGGSGGGFRSRGPRSFDDRPRS